MSTIDNIDKDHVVVTTMLDTTEDDVEEPFDCSIALDRNSTTTSNRNEATEETLNRALTELFIDETSVGVKSISDTLENAIAEDSCTSEDSGSKHEGATKTQYVKENSLLNVETNPNIDPEKCTSDSCTAIRSNSTVTPLIGLGVQDTNSKNNFARSKSFNNILTKQSRGSLETDVDKRVPEKKLDTSVTTIVSKQNSFEAGIKERLECVRTAGPSTVKHTSEGKLTDDTKSPLEEMKCKKVNLSPGILDLPMEVLALLFRRYFSFLEVSSFRMVCQRFSNVADYVLRTGLVSLKGALIEKMQLLIPLLIHQDKTETQKAEIIHHNKLRIFREYNILEILHSEYKMLKAVTWKHFNDDSMSFTGGYLLDEFRCILNMIHEDNVTEPYNRSQIDFHVSDMLCTFNAKFIRTYENNNWELSSGKTAEFGVRVFNMLDCCLNADSHLILTHGERSCHVLGHYDLRDCELPVLPVGGCEAAPEALEAWARATRTSIQQHNRQVVLARQQEMDNFARMHFDSLGTASPFLPLEPWRRRQKTMISSINGEERYRHILETRAMDCARHHRPRLITRLVVELGCANAEAPLDLRELLPVPDDERDDGPGQFCMSVTVHAVPPTEGGDGGIDYGLVPWD